MVEFDEKKALARNIRALREKFDITQQQLADIAGTSRQAVFDWEAAKRKTIRQDDVLTAITSHFDITKQDLFGFNDGLYAKLHGLTEAPAGAVAPMASASAFLPLRGRPHRPRRAGRRGGASRQRGGEPPERLLPGSRGRLHGQGLPRGLLHSR